MDSMFSSTDRCPNCGTRMAVDQRYCVECGERRTGGGLRDALPRTQAASVAATPARRRRPVLSPSSSLIAGVATLLLAMGVGVLIGRGGDNTPARAATPQVVTVAAGGASTTGAAGTAAAATVAKRASSKHSSHKKTASKAKVSGASSVAATAKKNGVKLPPKVVKVGQKCEKGAKGCQGGKFTGNFFGGG
jgi:hypothetical protein